MVSVELTMGKRNVIEKEVLIHLYCEKQYSAKKIASMLNSNKESILRYIHKYNISIIPIQRKSWRLRNLTLSETQKQIIIGSMMGDGCLALHGRKVMKARFIESHCMKQFDYLKWKFEALNPFCNSLCVKNGKWRGVSITTSVHDEFTNLYNMFYEDGIKIVSDKILQMLSPLSIAVWFMDDGSRDILKKTMRIFTCAFSYEENMLIRQYFKNKWNIECSLHTHNRKDGRSYMYIHFSVEESKKLTNLIRPYIRQTMLYKIGEHQILRDFMPGSKIKSELYSDIQSVAEMTTPIIEK